ncbi:MAG TPA: hypothetical protein VGK74_03500 [Symbiobacteriaceae bacterium]|jgi:hypothetical protein
MKQPEFLALGAALVVMAIGIWRSQRARGAAVGLAVAMSLIYGIATFFQAAHVGP